MRASYVKLTADSCIEFDQEEIALMRHILSYSNTNIAQYISDSTSGKYTAREVAVFLDKLRGSVVKIISAVGESEKHLFDDRYGGRKAYDPSVKEDPQ